eukprot:scaffold20310_cov125-Isochrysis_galbana.AAC.3
MSAEKMLHPTGTGTEPPVSRRGSRPRARDTGSGPRTGPPGVCEHMGEVLSDTRRHVHLGRARRFNPCCALAAAPSLTRQRMQTARLHRPQSLRADACASTPHLVLECRHRVGQLRLRRM